MSKKDDFDINIGNKIKGLREKKGFSQKDLAGKLGYKSATAISLIEAGERSIKTKDVLKLMNILETDFQYLFGDEVKKMANEKLEEIDFKGMVKQKIKELEYLIDNEK